MTEINAEHARALAEQVMGMEVLSARGLRAKELARIVLDCDEESPAEFALRTLACWLGVGGFNAPTVDAELYRDKIMEAVNELIAARGSELPALANLPDDHEVFEYCDSHPNSTFAEAVVALSGAEQAESKEIGLAILARAKDAAASEAARQAWDAYYFKCTPSIPLDVWQTIWRKAIAWWSEPVAQEQKS